MEFVPYNVELTFEVTFSNPSLHVGMSVYDTTGSSPSLVQGPTAMGDLVANTYYGKFTPSMNKSYVIFKAVYTDGTLATLNTNYAQGSESIYAGASSGGGTSAGCAVTGYVLLDNMLVGYVLPNHELTGYIQC